MSISKTEAERLSSIPKGEQVRHDADMDFLFSLVLSHSSRELRSAVLRISEHLSAVEKAGK